MSPADLVRRLRVTADPLDVAAADALAASRAEVERLQERVYQLEGTARLNAETIRGVENEKTVKTYSTAAGWLQRESAYLRKLARLLDTAGQPGGRLDGRLGPVRWRWTLSGEGERPRMWSIISTRRRNAARGGAP